MRRTGLTRRTPLQRVARLNPSSAKRRAQETAYRIARLVVWERDGGRCQAQVGWRWPDIQCAGPIDPHHVWRQSQHPERRCDPQVMMLLCRAHHDAVHANPDRARQAGFLK